MKNNIPTFEPNETCKLCQGGCCRNMGCHFSPDDFEEISFESLKTEIDKGYISIDWWEDWDKGNQYYLRIRNVDSPIIDPSWGGRCILLTDSGCSLPFEKRPLGARALKPRERYDGSFCHSYYTKEQCKNDWLKYDDILQRLVDYYCRRR